MTNATAASSPLAAVKKLEHAFVSALGMAPDADFPKLEYSKHELWDSVAHMRLVSEIEGTFDIMLDNEDIIGMSSFPVALEILRKHGIRLDA